MKKIWEECSDEELVALFQGGEKEVDEYIIYRYHRIIMQCAGLLYLSGGDREDLVQEGRMGLYDAIQTYDSSKNVKFEPFARLCISRAQFKAVQASNRKKHQPLNTYVSLTTPDDEVVEDFMLDTRLSDPEELYVSAMATMEMHNKIQKALSPMEREVLDYVLEGFSYRQISKFLGKDPKSIDNAFQRIRRKVREIIKDKE